MTGNKVRSEQVQNIARNYAAAAGSTVAWQTLGNDVIANYLTPGGSGTQSAPGTSASLDWTVPAGSFYPNFWASINSLGAAQTGVPATTYDATVWGASTGNTPSPLTFNTSFVDVLTRLQPRRRSKPFRFSSAGRRAASSTSAPGSTTIDARHESVIRARAQIPASCWWPCGVPGSTGLHFF